MGLLIRKGIVVYTILLIVPIIGLGIYLGGPSESCMSLVSSDQRDISIDPHGNQTIALSVFERRELIEYFTANLTDYLLNRTITVNISQNEGVPISFAIMNESTFKLWEENPTDEENMFQNIIRHPVSFIPEHPWGFYTAVLRNIQNSNLTVIYKSEQVFLLRTFNYDAISNIYFITLAVLIIFFPVQLKLRVTFDYLLEKATSKVTNRTYGGQGTRIPPVFTVGAWVIVVVVAAASILVSLQLNDLFPFTSQYWADEFFRLCIEVLFMAALLESIAGIAYLLWYVMNHPIANQYYGSSGEKKTRDDKFVDSLIKLLRRRKSLGFYAFLLLWVFLLLPRVKDTYLLILLLIGPFLIFLSYVAVESENEVNKALYNDPNRLLEVDFEYYKISLGSGLLLSLFLAGLFELSLILLQPVSQFILDRGVLYTHLTSSRGFDSVSAVQDLRSFPRTFLLFAIQPFGRSVFHCFLLNLARLYHKGEICRRVQEKCFSYMGDHTNGTCVVCYSLRFQFMAAVPGC